MRGFKWYTILFLVVLVIIQPNISEWFSIRGVSINFFLFFIMMTSFGIKHSHVISASLGLGLVYDMIYSPWIGRMTLVLLLAVLTVFAVNKIVYRENMPILTLYFFLATYLIENILTFIEVGPGVFISSFIFIQKTILGISIYATVLAAVLGSVFFLISMIKDRRLGSRRGQM